MKKNKKKNNKFFRFLKLIYIRLFRIHDSAQKISLGFGLGVFFGILPGSGPIAALIMASLFRLNRASALLGSLLTNTWLSVVTFILSVRIGSFVLGLEWHDVYRSCVGVVKNFHFNQLFQLSIFTVILPILLGYLIIGLSLGIAAYLFSWVIINYVRKKKAHLTNR